MLASLPEHHRLAITLRCLEGMDYEGIEQTMGLTNGALRGMGRSQHMALPILVIFIVCLVLAGLLMPSLGRARQSAKLAATMRQAGSSTEALQRNDRLVQNRDGG